MGNFIWRLNSGIAHEVWNPDQAGDHRQYKNLLSVGC